jgi:archaellum component FlaG (FlaF/FlaG flagellin family)
MASANTVLLQGVYNRVVEQLSKGDSVTVFLDGSSLTIEKLVVIARDGEKMELASGCSA